MHLNDIQDVLTFRAIGQGFTARENNEPDAPQVLGFINDAVEE